MLIESSQVFAVLCGRICILNRIDKSTLSGVQLGRSSGKKEAVMDEARD